VGRRLALLFGAVVVAALGTAMVFLYVKGADERALRDTNPQEVLVATTRVDAGTTVQAASAKGAFVRRALPRVAIADGAVSSINPIQDKIALTTIFPGQQILQQMFGDSAAATGPFAMPEGHPLAVAFSFADPNRVAGYVQPGSRVIVFATDDSANTTTVVLDDTTVVAVGPSTASTTAGSRTPNRASGTQDEASQALLTLALTRQEAQRMIQAASRGTLYLGLHTDRAQGGRPSDVGGASLSN
jgi:pilus assembly protein CpaB